MKKIHFYHTIFLLCFLVLSCNDAKKDTGEKTIWVKDDEHILTAQEITSLDSLYKSHEQKTSNEIALVTTTNIGSDSMQGFATNMGKKLGVGKKEKNNGVVIAFSKTLHQTAIATGLGTEKALTNDIAKKIIDIVMIPRFKENKYFDGLWNGSIAIIEYLEKPENKIGIYSKAIDSTKCDCESVYKDKKHGELLAIICNYINVNKIPPPLEPCRLSTTSLDSVNVKGTVSYLIKLSCCYTGDEFMIDKNTMRVNNYTPGDK